MLRNFFQVVLKHRRLSSASRLKSVEPLFAYVEKYWKKTRVDLSTSDFDLEECFTLLETQREDAIKANNEESARTLYSIEFALKSLLAELLSEFEPFSLSSEAMRAFGTIVYDQKPIIISFNYDTMTEAAIESGSGLRGSYPESMMLRHGQGGAISEDEVAFSHHNWNRPLGYGIQFDVVQLHRAGVGTYVDGKRFYSNAQNRLYDWEILKLHRSLNWFRFLPYRSFPSIDGREPVLPKWMESAVIHIEGHWWMGRPPDFDGWFIDPILVTPVLDKEVLFNEPLYSHVFAPLWKRAAEALASCKRLVIIGYSFSPTDFRAKRLFLESFANNDLEELIVVNPNRSAVEKAEALCHFKNAKVFPDLTSYMKHVLRGGPTSRAFLLDDDLSATFAEGRRAVEALDHAHFDLVGAFWFLPPSPGSWVLFLVSPIVDAEAGDALVRVQEILSSVKPPLKMESGAMAVLSPNSDLVSVMRKFIRTGPGISGTRLTRSVINGFKIEDAFVYRMQ